MKLSQDPTSEEKLEMKKYLEKTVVLRYNLNGAVVEKIGVLESIACSVLTIRTDDKSTLSLPYTLKLEID
jgi:hypothetical protein